MSIRLRMRAPARTVAGAALAAWAAMLAVFWPGVAMYDSVAQYGQALAGRYDDWHPPAMARLWALFGPDGTAPMLVVQASLYWLGLGLIATALARTGRHRAAWSVIAIGLWPPFLGWQVVVLKDTQMLAALLAALGIVARWRLRGDRVPRAAAVLAGLLLAYATLVRANAVFATIPLAIGLIAPPRGIAARAAVTLAAILATLTIAPLVNHRLLDATPSGVEKTQALYDLAGIAATTGDGDATGLSSATIAAIRGRHCVSPFFWDPLGAPGHCDGTMEAARTRSGAALYLTLAGAILRHPIAYGAHRAAHLNSTERWLVPLRWPNAAPPAGSEPNDLGLASPGAAAAGWQRLAAILVETPLGWPLCWVLAAAILLAGSWGRPGSSADTLARSLLVSALVLEASFVPLSIASDWRYHLWPMVATALAAALLAGGIWRWEVLRGGGAALLLAVGAGAAARALLPLPPASYAAMLG